jgi:hypothetical protein
MMDTFPFPLFVPILVVTLGLIQLAWYVAVIVLLFKIWQKVRHLPG